MSISAVTSSYIQHSQNKQMEDLSLIMSKKSLDIQEQKGAQAMQLIQSTSANLPDNLGKNIDVIV
ncbi:hypothetical protein MNBD_GAMMA26-491 [hydrothermal vent metagenome]|uniref:Motility protein n=1 Tax=hydrothermal vent metagenome TaxID=652676 RepID=A0A3B1BZH9_9ZZZZ